jgi:hypothetical protein
LELPIPGIGAAQLVVEQAKTKMTGTANDVRRIDFNCIGSKPWSATAVDISRA